MIVIIPHTFIKNAGSHSIVCYCLNNTLCQWIIQSCYCANSRSLSIRKKKKNTLWIGGLIIYSHIHEWRHKIVIIYQIDIWQYQNTNCSYNLGAYEVTNSSVSEGFCFWRFNFLEDNTPNWWSLSHTGCKKSTEVVNTGLHCSNCTTLQVYEHPMCTSDGGWQTMRAWNTCSFVLQSLPRALGKMQGWGFAWK